MRNFILFALGVILCCSCSSDVYQETNPVASEEMAEKDQLASVQSQIESLNKEMFHDNSQTRGLGRFFKKLFVVVLADITGGMQGCILGGPGAGAATAIVSSGYAATINPDNIKFLSPQKAKQTDTVKVVGMIPMNDSDIAISPSLLPTNKNSQITKTDSIGYFHNLVLKELNTTLCPNDYVLDSLIVKVASTTCKYYDEPIDDVVGKLNQERTFFEKISDTENYSTENCDDIHEIISVWKKQFPKQSDKFDVLETYFNGIANLDVEENNGEYMNRVLDVINKSSLEEDTKNELRNAFIVGNASYQLWNTEK